MTANDQASLTVQGGPNNGMTITLTGRPIKLGRRPDNDVMVNETTVSRRHALVLETDAGHVLWDLNSTNGTYVNGSRVGVQEYVLKHGDRIRLAGSDVTFIFRQEVSDTRKIGVDSPPTGAIKLGEHLARESTPREQPPLGPQPVGKREAELLRLLDSRKGEVVSREEIVRSVWPELAPGAQANEEMDRAVEGVRAQIEDDPKDPAHLITVGEFGYLLV